MVQKAQEKTGASDVTNSEKILHFCVSQAKNVVQIVCICMNMICDCFFFI